MGFGISVYSTEDFKLKDNMEYIKNAERCGIKMVFTSMHLPEVDYTGKLLEINRLMKCIKSLGMKLTVDISPAALKVLDASFDNLKPFHDLGIDCLRLDYGFTPKQTAAMSNNEYGISIELNASTITKEQIEEMIGLKVNMENVRTCHNFYPRPYTGLSWKFFIQKSIMIKSYGLKLGAFIPSRSGRRGPIFEGLPTIEEHRGKTSYTAARHLAYSGMVDDIYFGDAYASLDELKNVASIDCSIIEIGIELVKGVTDYEKAIIFSGIHTNRPDASEYIIRSEESRGYAQIGKSITPHNCTDRRKYSVTIDNIGFKRYSGELQICMADLPRDDRVNVVGYIQGEEQTIADLIKPGTRFRFRRD